MAVDTSQFRNGLKVEIDGEPYNMIFFQHVKPGKGGAFVRTKLKNLRNGKVVERTFRSGERLDEADVQDRRMSYLYQDSTGLVFMDSESYEQMSIPLERVGDAKLYLKENLEVDVLLYKGNAINIGLLPIELGRDNVNALVEAAADPNAAVTIDLPAQTITVGATTIGFDIDPAVKQRLISGIDRIGETLAHEGAIARHEASRPDWLPRTTVAGTG